MFILPYPSVFRFEAFFISLSCFNYTANTFQFQVSDSRKNGRIVFPDPAVAGIHSVLLYNIYCQCQRIAVVTAVQDLRLNRDL
jgi:hypothetical protein